MKLKLFIFLLLFSSPIFAQSWSAIYKTRISFSAYNTEDNRTITKYEYFKKGDLLIAVNQFLATDFYKVFSKYPKIFDDIYKVATVIDKTELEFDKKKFGFTCLDTTIASVEFKQVVIINNREFISGIKEYIWVLINGSDLNMQLGGVHYINLVFSNKKSKQKYLGAKNGQIVL